jgi:integrase
MINQLKTSGDPNYCVRVAADDGERGDQWLADDAIDWEGGTISVFRNVVDTDDAEVIVKETKSEAGTWVISVPAELLAVLREQRTRVLAAALKWGKGYSRDPLYLFPGPGGAVMHPRLITNRMDRLIARAGIVAGEGKKISPVHSWRHTSGTLLWRSRQGRQADSGPARALRSGDHDAALCREHAGGRRRGRADFGGVATVRDR